MPKTRTAEVDLGDLCEAIRADRKTLEAHRVARREIVRRYAGDQYTTETSYQKRPVNFLSLYLSVLPPKLVSHDPRVCLSTFEKDYKSVVSGMELWANEEVERIGLAETLHRAVLDALIGPQGIVKVALATPSESEMRGWEVKYGQPFAQVVDLDDWVIDMHARHFSEAAYMGHRVRVPLNSLKNSDLYESIKRKQVVPNRDKQYNEPGDERIGMLGRQYVAGQMVEAYEYVDLWEIYLPREKMIMTLLSEDGGTPYVDEYRGKEAVFSQRDWVGPYCGPYYPLSFLTVPGNLNGKGPIQDVSDMDDDFNKIVSKLFRQAARQKEVWMYNGTSDSDMQRFKDAGDGDAARCDNPDKIGVKASTGPNPNNAQFAIQVWQWLNKISGNLEVIGGLGEQAGTATQEKLLNANAGSTVTDKQHRMTKFTSKVFEGLCWFWHHHPQKVMTGYRPVTGLSSPIKQNVTPAQRQKVPFEAMRIKVDPYSMTYQTPGEKLAFLNQLMTQIVMPMMPFLKEQGINVRLDKYLEHVAKYGNSPEVEEVIEFSAVPDQVDQQSGVQGDGRNERPAKPSVSDRTYNRVNSSEATSQGQDQTMRAALMRMNPGGSQAGTMQPMGAR